MIRRARIALAAALLVPGIVLTYSGLLLCLASRAVEPPGSEE